MGPGLAEHVPEGTHVGQNVHYTDYSYSYETSKKIQDAAGFKLLTIGKNVFDETSHLSSMLSLLIFTLFAFSGAGPCGTPTQPYPHYSVHFYTVDKSDREKMLCKSNGGYFCLPASEQCSESAMKFNLDGQGIEMCEDGSIANVPPGFRWTIDGNPAIGINAGSPGMGLHGLNPSDLGGSYETPLLLMVNYDATIIANHIVLWGGLPLGQNNPGEDYHWTKEMPTYNCHNKEKYPSLPVKTSVDYVVAEGRTYISITGPTAKCTKSFTESWDSTKGSKAAKQAKGAIVGRRVS